MPVASAQIDHGALEQGVLAIVRDLLREVGSEAAIRTLTLNSALERDLGLGSLERVELLVRCEKRFGVRLPDDVAERADTPADWVRALEEGRRSEARTDRYRIAQPSREAPEPPASACTWVEVLRRHAEVEPDRVHVHLLDGDSGEDISYGKLYDTASRVAAGLKAGGLEPNQTVAIMLPTSCDFFYAFFGVMLAGGVPVPIYPPARPDKIEEYVRRQVKILRNAEVRFLITFSRARAVSELMGLSLPSLAGVTSVEALKQAGDQSGPRQRALDVQPSDIAFIQYTSGSTGDPKGVVLTQANVLANVRGIGWSVHFRPDDVVVTWLPLYHDMGLIGSWLFSVYFGAPITVLSPLDFLARPARWLWALHDSGGTLCPAPNFSYELCARKIRDEAIEGLDLSRWRVAINAGEAVLPDTLEHFARRFAPYGFRPEAYVPCYGLAESSVALTFPSINRPPRIDSIERDAFSREGRAVPCASARGGSRLLRFVANGRPLPGHEVRVLDNEGRDLGERIQGRILFRGPSRTAGYYRNPEATRAVINEDGWMDSGDLGYWADGELFVTGRAKDLIIKAGHNIVPQEIELAAAEVKGVRRGCVAAFGSRDASSGTERLIVVGETRETQYEARQRIEAEIIQRVTSATGLPPDQIVLAAPQSIPKTSSGKIRRSETRLLFEAGKLRAHKRPPWLQMMRLAAGNAGHWLGMRARVPVQALNRAYIEAAWTLVAGTGASLARLAPSQRTALARTSARWLLRLTGRTVKVEAGELLQGLAPAVLVANRAGHLDALVLAAALPHPFLLADGGEIGFMPRRASVLLKNLTVEPVPDEAHPPGGTLRDRVQQALAAGYSVLVLPDSAPGSPAHLSRFRLDAFHAAQLTSRPLVPLSVRGTSRLLDQASPGVHHQARITVGTAIDADCSGRRELVALRERVRTAIAELCR